MVITSEIVCRTGTVGGQAKKNNVSIPRKTGKSTIVTHGTIRVNICVLMSRTAKNKKIKITETQTLRVNVPLRVNRPSVLELLSGALSVVPR